MSVISYALVWLYNALKKNLVFLAVYEAKWGAFKVTYSTLKYCHDLELLFPKIYNSYLSKEVLLSIFIYSKVIVLQS